MYHGLVDYENYGLCTWFGLGNIEPELLNKKSIKPIFVESTYKNVLSSMLPIQ